MTDDSTSGTAVLEGAMAAVIITNAIAQLAKILGDVLSGKPVTLDELRAKLNLADQADADWAKARQACQDAPKSDA